MALPFELIFDEILCRVPVKYLLRCVSKGWCSIIDSPAFVKKHLKKAIECNPEGDGVIITGANKYCLTDFESLYASDDDVSVIELNDHDPLKTVLSGTYFVGSASCLVCFCKNGVNEFIVVNPLTRKYRNVPSLPREVATLFEMIEVSPRGFGYDHVNDDYKVVTIAQFEQKDPLEFLGIIVMVYSLKSNSWTEIRNFPNDIALVSFLGIFTSGVVHWFAYKYSEGLCDELIVRFYNKKKIIVGYDLGLEKFVELPFPTADENFRVPDGGTLCSSLCIFDHSIKSRTDVWMMNNYGAENPWYKAFYVERQGALGSFLWVEPVAFSKRSKNVLLEVANKRLLWYDLERKVVKNVRIHGIPNKFRFQLYRESLFQLTENDQMQKPSEDKKEKKQQKKRVVFTNSPFFITAEEAGAIEAGKIDDYKEIIIPSGKTYEVLLDVESINSYIAWDFSIVQGKMNMVKLKRIERLRCFRGE